VFTSLLDAILLDLPELRTELTSRYTKHWVSGNLNNFDRLAPLRDDLTGLALNTSGKQAYLGSVNGQLSLQDLTRNSAGHYSARVLTVESGTFVVTDLVIDPRGKW